MRVIITGDRGWSDSQLAGAILTRMVARYGADLVVVHGGATGVDESFETAAGGRGIATEAHPARWDELDKRAGPVRNGETVAAGAGLCVALHRAISSSKGTKDCANRAIRSGIPTYLVDSPAAVPRRLRADDSRLE